MPSSIKKVSKFTHGAIFFLRPQKWNCITKPARRREPQSLNDVWGPHRSKFWRVLSLTPTTLRWYQKLFIKGKKAVLKTREKNAETCVIWPRDGDEATPPLDNSKCPKMSLASSSWSWPSPTLFSGDGGEKSLTICLICWCARLFSCPTSKRRE